ncbi:MAG: cytochrome-c oxidase, cbb3-type subunit II, partial [Opitutae bacterium]|nr:cytochrome-c oxidase, cbb3-type subunit II [Opitutae bacterium]
IPVLALKSYSIFGGAQDALVQWWYGHNAVAFFLTTPILGIMYYFLPKAADRPVYSYRLSIVHFWALVFLYIWAGPHHLHYTALPDWASTLGMLFSLMLIAPSWGGMINGLLTLRGAWDKLRTDPVIKFFAAGVTFYGMATFAGPLLAIKSVNALGHYTDWIIAHVHAGALGWNGFMAAGMFYWLVPRLWNKPLHSQSLANLHFWIGLTGILLYVAAMWASGITQGLMLNATAEGGTILKYPNFLETLNAIRPLMLLRVAGGLLYLSGFVLLGYNIWRSIRGAQPVNGTMEVYVEEVPAPDQRLGLAGTFLNAPVAYALLAVIFACVWMFTSGWLNIIGLVATLFCVLLAVGHFQTRGTQWGEWYDRLLVSALPFTILTFLAVVVGGLIQIIPLLTIDRRLQTEDRVARVYTPLELAGRDLFVREGCYLCHSQMIRTLVPDVMRYGDYSRLGESIWDHPYQWGSKRTGPDLARVGLKYNHAWHYDHMENPRNISTGSNMPSYPWLKDNPTDYAALTSKIRVQKILGVPYPSWSPAMIDTLAKEQAKDLARELRAQGRYVDPDREIVALIAYLQCLGKTSEAPATPVAGSQ